MIMVLFPLRSTKTRAWSNSTQVTQLANDGSKLGAQVNWFLVFSLVIALPCHEEIQSVSIN